MNPTGKPPTTERLPGHWWLVWLAVALLGAVIPYFHSRSPVAELIEPLRYPWGLLPAHWLIFRSLGQMTGWVLVGVAIAGIVAWFRPAVGRQAIVLSAVITLAVTVFYGLFCGKFVFEFLKGENQRIKEERGGQLPGKLPGAEDASN